MALMKLDQAGCISIYRIRAAVEGRYIQLHQHAIASYHANGWEESAGFDQITALRSAAERRSFRSRILIELS